MKLNRDERLTIIGALLDGNEADMERKKNFCGDTEQDNAELDVLDNQISYRNILVDKLGSSIGFVRDEEIIKRNAELLNKRDEMND